MVVDGYKHTEIGMLPIEWELKSYGDVFKFLTTATYSRADLSDNGEIQYLHYGDIHTKYHFSLDFSKYQLPSITTEQVKKYPLLADGDIVMADASEDYAGICKSVELKGLESKKAIAGLHTFLLRDRNSVFVDGFRGYASASSLLKKQFNRLATGMKVFGVSKNNLKMVQIPIPPKLEQKAIAIALSNVDEFITSLESLIIKKENIKRGAIQQLLRGKKQLDTFSKGVDAYKQTEIGLIPEDWEIKTIESLTPKNKKFGIVDGPFGSNLKTIHYKTKGIPIITSGYVTSGVFIAKNYIYVDKEKFLLEKRSAVSAGDIVMAKIGANCGASAILPYDHETGILSGNSLKITIDENNNNTYYIWQVLWDLYVNNKIEELKSVGAQPAISMSNLKKYLIPIPPKLEQEAIAAVLLDMDTELELLKIRLLKTEAIKTGMMQELLTGKTRLLEGVSNVE